MSNTTFVNDNTDIKQQKLHLLRSLDRRVRHSSKVYAYVFGGMGFLLFLFGFFISIIFFFNELLFLGLVSNILGTFMCVISYPIYVRMVEHKKAKYTEKINALVSDLLDE